MEYSYRTLFTGHIESEFIIYAWVRSNGLLAVSKFGTNTKRLHILNKKGPRIKACGTLRNNSEGTILTHLFPMHPFSPPELIRKPYNFLIFSGDR